MTRAATVRLMGETTVVVDGSEVALAPGKTAALLAVLALNGGHVVEMAPLVDELWDEDPPISARALVHTYVSTLRRALSGEGQNAPQVLTVSGGYRLAVEANDVDALRFLGLRAEDLTNEELEAALAESAHLLLPGNEIRSRESWRFRIANQRATLQGMLWARLADGTDPAIVVPDLRAAVQTQPLREDTVLLLARALGACGRRDEGLSVLESYRVRLSEELGLDPSPLVGDARQQLISGRGFPSFGKGGTQGAGTEPGMAPSQSSSLATGTVRRRPRARALVAVSLAAVGILAAVILALPDDSPRAEPVNGPSLLILDPQSGTMSDAIDLPVAPSEVYAADGVAWVRSEADRAAARVDLSNGKSSVVGLPESPTSLALIQSSAMIGLGFTGTVVTIDGGHVSAPQAVSPGSQGRVTLASGSGRVWASTIDGLLVSMGGARPDEEVLRVHGAPRRMAVDSDQIWVITGDRQELIALDIGGGEQVVSALRGDPVDVAAAKGEAWVVTSGDDRLWRASAARRRVITTRVLPGPPVGIVVGPDRIWVAIRRPALLMAFDRVSLEPMSSADLRSEPVDLAETSGDLIVAVR